MLQARLSSNLKAYRERRGLSQTQLASKAGIHSNTLARIERGEKGASFETVEMLAEALAVDPASLLKKVSES